MKSISHKFFFPYVPEVVWEYLTKAGLIKQWLMPNGFLPIIGYDFKFRTNPLPHHDFYGIACYKVPEIIPLKKLSYPRKSSPGSGTITLDSIVVWKLHPKDNGTELFPEQSDFKEIENSNTYSLMNDGWFRNLQENIEQINISKNGTTNT